MILSIGLGLSACYSQLSTDNDTNGVQNELSNTPHNMSELGMESVKSEMEIRLSKLYESKREKKPLLVYFSGYGSVNSRYFEQSILVQDEIYKLIKEEFITCIAYVDDPDSAIVIKNEGKDTVREAYRDWWEEYQRKRYGVFEQPFFDIVNSDNESLVSSQAGDEYHANVSGFLNWLKIGLSNYKKQINE